MVSDPTRRWTQEVTRLRTRIARLRRRAGPTEATEQDELLEETILACESLLRDLAGAQLEIEMLRRRNNERAAYWHYFFQRTPIACVEVDAAGMIVRANSAASVLLSSSSKHLENRPLVYFAEQRDAFSGLMKALPLEREEVRTMLTLRPRERAARTVEATIVAASNDDDRQTWVWFFVPAERPRPAVATPRLVAANRA